MTMKVGDLIYLLVSEGEFQADDSVSIVGRSKLVIGRGPVVVGEIDFEEKTMVRGFNLRLSADACAYHEGAVSE